MKLSLTAVKCQYVVSAKIKLKKTKWERKRKKAVCKTIAINTWILADYYCKIGKILKL